MDNSTVELIINFTSYKKEEPIYLRHSITKEQGKKLTTLSTNPGRESFYIGFEYDRVDCPTKEQPLLDEILEPIKDKRGEAIRYMKLAADRYYQNDRRLNHFFKLKEEDRYRLSKQGLWLLETSLVELDTNTKEQGNVNTQALSFQLSRLYDSLFNYTLARKLINDGDLKLSCEVVPHVPNQTATTLGKCDTVEIVDEQILINRDILQGSQMLLGMNFEEQAKALEKFLDQNNANEEDKNFWRRQLWKKAEELLNATERKKMIVDKIK